VEEQQTLMELGFTKMEANIYIYLLKHPALTGYAISKSLGEAAAYIYRSLDSLNNKGALITEVGDKTVYRAIPYNELLAQMKRQFDKRCANVESQLKNLSGPVGDNKVYNLSSVEQVYERCHAMINRCQHILYMDCYPGPLNELKDCISSAYDRGVKVGLQIYDESDVKATVLSHQPAPRHIKEWNRQWIRIGVDGSEYLIALLNANCDKVLQAIWSENAVLSWIEMYAIGSDLEYSNLFSHIESGATNKELKAEIENWNSKFRSRTGPMVKRMEGIFHDLKG
jgi:HTH-type transcriptional regulator, sugar sensing transcriptional regulator